MPNGYSLPRFKHERDEEDTAKYHARQHGPEEDFEEADSSASDANADKQHDDGDTHRELHRAGKIDAYLSYLKMRPPQREAGPVTLRRSVEATERPLRRYLEDDAEREMRLYGYQQRSIKQLSPRAPRFMPRRPQRRNHTRDIAIAAVLSLAVGGLTGLIVYDRTSGGVLADSVTTKLAGLWTSEAPPPQAAPVAPQPQPSLADAELPPQTVVQAPVSKKPVAIAQLDVEDASGMASSLIPLSLRADPGVPGQNLALRLSGLPDKAYLTAGTRVSNDAWMLRPGEEHNVKLVVPPTGAGQFAIEVEAIEARTGDLAAPVKEFTVDVRPAFATKIEPAAAPASVTRNFNLPQTKPESVKPGQPLADSAMPIPAPIEKTAAVQPQLDAAQSLVRSGDKLMDLGDLTAARQFYAKALDNGIAEAALKLGQTYDPAVFAEKNVQGLKSDPSMAMKYYLQAQASGIANAAGAISTLDAWMQQK